MLASRVALIRDYVKAVEAGQLPLNHEVIREANALTARLPVLQTELFQPQFYKQCNDAALMTLMGSVQKSCNDLMQFINKYNVLHQRQWVSGRRMRGIFFWMNKKKTIEIAALAFISLGAVPAGGSEDLGTLGLG